MISYKIVVKNGEVQQEFKLTEKTQEQDITFIIYCLQKKISELLDFEFDKDFEIDFLPRPPKPAITQKGRILESTEADRYQWYLDGNKITGANKQTFEMAEIGLYSVEAINENGCGTLSDVFDVTSSVNDNSSVIPRLSIIPNPNSGNFHISIGGLQPGDYDLVISDVFGRRIVSYDLEPAGGGIEKDFDLQYLPAGLYLIHLANRSINIYSKFIKR